MQAVAETPLLIKQASELFTEGGAEGADRFSSRQSAGLAMKFQEQAVIARFVSARRQRQTGAERG